MSVNIVLIGLMGCGKTTVGKALSKLLKNYTLIDTDEVIVDLEGMSISQIFEEKTEKYFRSLEEKIIEELSSEEGLIISLGGGSFESEKTRKNLSENCITVYLKATVDILFERVKDDSSRPLLNCKNPKNKLSELLSKREQNYLKADCIIETDNMTINDIAEEIVSKINH